ncbi:putative glycosyl hydrolase (putative secreted protein) [Flavobacteria bacterium BAL38]|nr:putative glycosyl hydrolase (putative secreted protein) [Flavobacteria bacterium BAL38]
MGIVSGQTTIPYEVINNSPHFSDNEIYIGLVGQTTSLGAVWIDFNTNAANAPALIPINETYNTIHIEPGDWGYADMFTPLSEITDGTLHIPAIFGCRMYISFVNPMYIHFFDSGGYTGPDLQNPADPNSNIRFEIIELTWSSAGLWTNTTRVDAYQYPMGLEIWGTFESNNAYKKAGELISHEEIINLFQQAFPIGDDFYPCYSENDLIGPSNLPGIIEQPSKLEEFKEGGVSEFYFQDYIDAVWSYFKDNELAVSIPNWGVFRGYVEEGTDILKMSNENNVEAWINGRPNTQEVIEAKGKLAENVLETPSNDADLVFQAQFCAAMNRGVIDYTLASGVVQDWGNETNFFNANFTHNKYVAFFHQPNITYDSKTYAFAYDDVFDQSSTLQTSIPDHARITIGGFYDYSLGITENTTDSILTITYPNPTSDYVMLSITDSALTDLSYSLFDISGKALANGKITAADTKIEMGNLPLATYILKVNQNNKELKTFKIIKK